VAGPGKRLSRLNWKIRKKKGEKNLPTKMTTKIRKSAPMSRPTHLKSHDCFHLRRWSRRLENPNCATAVVA
jgi:hypothetical protein